MAINMKQSLGLKQGLKMSPQLKQAIALLEVNRMELSEFIDKELAENPCLEKGSPENHEESGVLSREKEHNTDDIVSGSIEEASKIVDKTDDGTKAEVDWEAMARLKESGVTRSESNGTRKNNDQDGSFNFENIASTTRSLTEHLHKQVRELDFNKTENLIATQIIGNTNDRGYLTATLPELKIALEKDIQVSEEEIDDILDTIQRLDPFGVCTLNLKDCLLNQLRDLKLKNGIVEKIVSQHLNELETNNYDVIASSLGISTDSVIENVAIISELEPIPGRQFTVSMPQYVIPDVYVFKLGNKWVVTLNEEGLPRVKVNNFYSNKFEDKSSKNKEIKQAKSYINERTKSAKWFIKSLHERQRTILSAAEVIVRIQEDFFEKGVQFLKPLVLQEIADELNKHASTISRITRGKYMHTPRGVYELKYFCNSSVQRIDGKNTTSEAVKTLISDMVKAEDSKKPLSDQKIVEILREKGISLARRTVAKYREQLKILPSRKRKKHF